MKSLKYLLYLILNQSHLSSSKTMISLKCLQRIFNPFLPVVSIFLIGAISSAPGAVASYSFQPTSKADSCFYYIKVNIHFMLKGDGSGNFTETDDGTGNSQYNGYDYARDLYNIANHCFSQNPQMRLPVGNNTPNLPIKIRYVLSGVYFHRDDKYYNFNYSFDLHRKYAKDPETEINVYLQESAEGGSQGVASGIGVCEIKAFKLHSPWSNYKKGKGAWFHSLGFNHEMGHLLGLRHSFMEDGCADTPDISEGNYNCWNINEPARNVKTPPGGCEIGSNNLMDYNANRLAVTPCQLEKMYFHLNSTYTSYAGCYPTFPGTALFRLSPNICSDQPVILDGSQRAVKPESSYAIEIYETAHLEDSRIIAGYWSEIFQGRYEKINLSDLYPFGFQAGKIYRVKLSVTDTLCSTTDDEVKYIY